MRLRRDGTLSIATSEIFFGICKARRGFTVWQRAMPAPICSNIHRINEVTNNRQQLVVEGFSFYAVAEISTTRYNMNKLIRLTESDLHRIVKESVQRILKETRLDYNVDNFSGRYSRNADNTIPYQGKLFAFDVDDRGKIYKYGQQPIDVISQCESEAERYGQGHCSVETYESEEDYINAIRNYIKKGYVVTN